MVIENSIAFLNDNPAAFAWSNYVSEYASFLDIFYLCVSIFIFFVLYSDQLVFLFELSIFTEEMYPTAKCDRAPRYEFKKRLSIKTKSNFSVALDIPTIFDLSRRPKH